MAIIIAGERSGVGKTTITLAILAYLKSQKKSVQSFKVGPDYIDPMFHTKITGQPCRNLDPILTSEDYVKWCFNYYSQTADLSIIEGVMGLFDGLPIDSLTHYASTAHIAQLLNLPVVLVLDCSKLSTSIGAIAWGYANLVPTVKIVGVILNQVASQKHLSLLQEGLKTSGITLMGVWFREQNIKLPSRHLGLVPTDEISEHQTIFQRLAQLAQQNINWDLLSPYLTNHKATYRPFLFLNIKQKYDLKIAIARDKSFNFYYQDNLDILVYLGVELIPFSPLQDQDLPINIDGLYLGGGFPEMFASELAGNISLKSSLYKAISQGLPVYAECGGMMYLGEAIVDFQGQKWSMVGVLKNTTTMSKKLTLGYREATVLVNDRFVQANSKLVGHEFHRALNSDIPEKPQIAIADKYSQQQLSVQGWQKHNIYSSYLHLHFGTIIPQVEKFLQGCLMRSNN